MIHRKLRLMVCMLGCVAGCAAQVSFQNERHVYIRGEVAVLKLRVTSAKGPIVVDTRGWVAGTLSRGNGETSERLNPALLHAGDYEVRVQVRRPGQSADHAVEQAAVFQLTIAPEQNPQRFPLW